MIMVTGDITIPPREKVYKTDISCKYKGPSINVFAYRVHAHVHGDVNTAYLIHNHEWTKVAQGDPQWPQAFYPLDKKIEVNEDDILVGRCVYHNNEDRTIYAGYISIFHLFISSFVSLLNYLFQDLLIKMKCATFISCITQQTLIMFKIHALVIIIRH